MSCSGPGRPGVLGRDRSSARGLSRRARAASALATTGAIDGGLLVAALGGFSRLGRRLSRLRGLDSISSVFDGLGIRARSSCPRVGGVGISKQRSTWAMASPRGCWRGTVAKSSTFEAPFHSRQVDELERVLMSLAEAWRCRRSISSVDRARRRVRRGRDGQETDSGACAHGWR